MLRIIGVLAAALAIAGPAYADHGTGQHWATSDWPALAPPPTCPLQRTLLVRDQTNFSSTVTPAWKTYVLTAQSRWTAATTVGGCPRYKFIYGAGTPLTCNQTMVEPNFGYFPNTIRICRDEPDVPPGASWAVDSQLHIGGARIGVPATINWGNPTWIRDMLTHELGHTLGLLHSTVPGSVMFNINVHVPGPHDVELVMASTAHTP